MNALSWAVLGLVSLQAYGAVDYKTDPTVQLFQEYLQINTVTHRNLTSAVEFWQKRADSENVTMCVYEYTKGYPLIVIKWPGANSSLSSIMLNSHLDVVPANEEDGWTYPPFSAHIDDNGNIYARGSQDMKSVSIQYFEAMRRLKANNVTLLRDVYMTLTPDEEVGGVNGMLLFLDSEEFAAMNIGFSMDEGSSFPIDTMAMFYQDKVVWQIQIECYGVGGHSSTFPATNTTATGKCTNVINRLFEFRDEQYKIYVPANVFDAGIYSNVNLNIINSGSVNNVIPSRMTLLFDIRPDISLNADRFDAQLREWLDESGSNITLTYIQRNPQSPAVILNETNPYWVAVSNAIQNLNISVMPLVSPGSTDARHIRNKGIPAFGFSPMPNTPLLLHSVNEYLNAETFLQGIKTYEEFIVNLANIPADKTNSEPFTYVASTAV